MNIGEVLSLDVEKPAAGGRMLARHHGQVVLVGGAIPGERVSARVTRVSKGVGHADTIDVLTPSADRREERGDWRCGGNALAHVAYARQLQLKAEIIGDAFRRIGRLPLAAAPAVIASPELGYRMRARLHARGGRLGFFREGTHEICDAAATGQLLPSTNAWIGDVERRLRADGLSGLVGLEIAENVAGDSRVCHLDLQGGIDAAPFAVVADGLAGLSAQPHDRPTAVVLAGTPVIDDVLHARENDPASALRLQRSVRAFFQGNRYLLEPLVRHVVGLVPSGPVVDLYAGVGLFGLSLAAAGIGPVVLVEGDPVSGADLRSNAEVFAARVRIERRSVESFLGTRAGAGAATFVVDPPRTGLSKDALTGIARQQPAQIVYVSCDVATLARDARALVEAGYQLNEVTGIDLFPNTAHVETIVTLHRQQ